MGRVSRVAWLTAVSISLSLSLSLQERCVAALARVERTDFLSPMCIGEVAHVSAEITYTSKHSVEVQVNVMSENILTGNLVLLARPPWMGVVGRLSNGHDGPGGRLLSLMTPKSHVPASMHFSYPYFADGGPDHEARAGCKPQSPAFPRPAGLGWAREGLGAVACPASYLPFRNVEDGLCGGAACPWEVRPAWVAVRPSEELVG